MTDDELILSTLALLMGEVRWTRADDSVHQFVTTSRRVKLFSDVSDAQQPACFQAEWASDEAQVSGMPYKTVVQANWIIYQRTGSDKNIEGAIENNLIIGGVRQVLFPKPTDPGFLDERNTLGGLVYHCFISGRLFKDPGDIDDQAMLVIPIKLLVP